MAKIRVQHRFGSGDMGDGWSDNVVAAKKFADELRAVWAEDLQLFVDAGHNFHITVAVMRDTHGGSAMSIEVSECEAGLENYQMEKLVEASLTDSNLVFDHFCNSPDAMALAA